VRIAIIYYLFVSIVFLLFVYLSVSASLCANIDQKFMRLGLLCITVNTVSD